MTRRKLLVLSSLIHLLPMSNSVSNIFSPVYQIPESHTANTRADYNKSPCHFCFQRTDNSFVIGWCRSRGPMELFILSYFPLVEENFLSVCFMGQWSDSWWCPMLLFPQVLWIRLHMKSVSLIIRLNSSNKVFLLINLFITVVS